MTHIANRYGRTVSQIVFRFALDVGMIPLTGTTSATHMLEALEIFSFQMDSNDLLRIEGLIEH
jgi:diketogulonate reductase-like aldo/keto reductase